MPKLLEIICYGGTYMEYLRQFIAAFLNPFYILKHKGKLTGGSFIVEIDGLYNNVPTADFHKFTFI